MKRNKQWIDEFYAGLRDLDECSFPKTCNMCGRTYGSANDFVTKTEGVQHPSGLSEMSFRDKIPFVGLFRNCLCGSTIVGTFKDRRDTSKKGIRARQRFGKLLDMLVEAGLDADIAREELKKLLRGEESKIDCILRQEEEVEKEEPPIDADERG